MKNKRELGVISEGDHIANQYDNFSGDYSESMEIQDEIGNLRFYEILKTIDLKDKQLLDVGCGDGTDLSKFRNMGAITHGVEPSEEFVNIAKDKNPESEVVRSKGEDLSVFKDKFFDVVVSKYAMQTSPDVPKIFEEVARVLKPEGYFIFLSKHPLRQFIEKIQTHKKNNTDESKEEEIDYFKQEIVESNIFENTIHLKEPSHTLTEYFSPEILKNFDLKDFCEDKDFPASEQINGMIYPTFFVAKYQKRAEKNRHTPKGGSLAGE